jgi:CheY-like chemotaxis protein
VIEKHKVIDSLKRRAAAAQPSKIRAPPDSSPAARFGNDTVVSNCEPFVRFPGDQPMQSTKYAIQGPAACNRNRGFLLKTTILLVEDNKIQRLTNERILHRAGYTVLNAADGEEALRVASTSIPDLILLDMLLPKLGGREVMQALKRDPATVKIPILFFSSLSQANEARLKNEGAAGYFEKSRLVEHSAAGEKELIQLIETIVQKSRQRSGPGVQAGAHGTVAGAD